jgi:hypothetical protein
MSAPGTDEDIELSPLKIVDQQELLGGTMLKLDFLSHGTMKCTTPRKPKIFVSSGPKRCTDRVILIAS